MRRRGGDISVAFVIIIIIIIFVVLVAFCVLRRRSACCSRRAAMRNIVDHESSLPARVLARNVRLPAQETNTVLDEGLLHDKGDAGLLLGPETHGAQLHADPDVQQEEALHPVEVPGVDVDVCDWGGQYQDTV